jgi:protein phosphatase
VETQEIELADRDVYLLCSDGVARQLAESEIRKILMRDESAEARAKALVDLSLEKGGVDNATAVVVAFDRIPEASSDVRQEEAGVPEHAEWENEGNDVTPPTE